MHVLVVEDDFKIARFIQQGLESEGHHVDRASDGAAGLERALSGRYDLVLLDLTLPALDGLELLRSLRQSSPSQPVIAVTARGDVADRVRGLDEGADDYLVKPFSFVELTARIRALFRRTDQALTRTIELVDLVVDRLQRSARCGDAEVQLSQREFQLLEFLMQGADEPKSRSAISDRVWGYQFDTGTNVVDVYINYLRKKLRTLGLEPIRTLRGIGYVLERDRCRDPKSPRASA